MTTDTLSNWHPLTWLSYVLDVTLFGAPGAMHLTNLFFHLVNTVLVFWVLRKMSGTIWRSAFVAALFALHPTHIEFVAWISERKRCFKHSFLDANVVGVFALRTKTF